MWPVIDAVLEYGSGEFLLRKRANGGTVVFLRALISTLFIYAFLLTIRERVTVGATWCFGAAEIKEAIRDTFPMFGAVFAAAYAALYARFAAQWNYLASLYNQIKASEVRTSPANKWEQEVLASWKAGYIEDAENLHLHMKGVHAAVIVNWLSDPAVRREFEQSTVGSLVRLARVEAQARAAVERERQRYLF